MAAIVLNGNEKEGEPTSSRRSWVIKRAYNGFLPIPRLLLSNKCTTSPPFRGNAEAFIRVICWCNPALFRLHGMDDSRRGVRIPFRKREADDDELLAQARCTTGLRARITWLDERIRLETGRLLKNQDCVTHNTCTISGRTATCFYRPTIVPPTAATSNAHKKYDPTTMPRLP